MTRKRGTNLFGTWLYNCRQRANHTLDQVGRRIGSHKGYISGIELGAVNPPSKRIILKIARFYKADPAKLMLMAWIDKAPEEIRPLVASKFDVELESLK